MNKNDKKLAINKKHKIHHNTSTSKCNIIILFVMFDKIQFVGISDNNAIEDVKIVDCFRESIHEF